MPYYCTVPRCTSMAGKAKNVSFHQFPRDEELANLWNAILKRGKPYTKYSKVCSLHFKPEDYTITSVGKNKGQWRTLRRDAVPSQKLPSDSPPPIHKVRRQSSYLPASAPGPEKSMNHSLDGSGLGMMPKDLVRSYEMAQAIYVQTMLAMQASQGKDASQPSMEPESPKSRSPSPLSHLSSENSQQDSDPKDPTFKCDKCLKLFKDPDVFVLHTRTHTNEKENIVCNIQTKDGTLKANPILANLLTAGIKTDGVIDVNNILSIENNIMSALTANMESYIRNLSGLINPGEARSSEDNSSEQAGDCDSSEHTIQVGNCDRNLHRSSSDALVIDEAM